jgi:secernin
MGCDMVVALSRATVDGGTLFGHNCNQLGDGGLVLLRLAGRVYSPGETVHTGAVALPQVRRTWTVLAGRCPADWGYQHGLNEHGVAIGLTAIRTRLQGGPPALTGADLVRLGLERAASARQAVDVLTDLARRHGQAGTSGLDPAFLIGDGREAFVVEMSGPHWAVQAVNEVRAVSDVCQLRQDWDHLSPGLADLAISRGWWPANGSKLDFAGAVSPEGGDNAAALRRWGRATLLLEQHNGQIDLPALRRVLSDHFDGLTGGAGPGMEGTTGSRTFDHSSTLCQHGTAPTAPRTSASLIAQMGRSTALPIAWYSFGPPCRSIYFPLLLAGELPSAYQESPAGGGNRLRSQLQRWSQDGTSSPSQQTLLRAALAGLQNRFDQETREFIAEAAVLQQRGESGQLPRLAELFMQHTLECWENVCQEFAPTESRPEATRPQSEPTYSGAWS